MLETGRWASPAAAALCPKEKSLVFFSFHRKPAVFLSGYEKFSQKETKCINFPHATKEKKRVKG